MNLYIKQKFIPSLTYMMEQFILLHEGQEEHQGEQYLRDLECARDLLKKLS